MKNTKKVMRRYVTKASINCGFESDVLDRKTSRRIASCPIKREASLISKSLNEYLGAAQWIRLWK